MKWLLPGLAIIASPAVAADGLTGDWGGARTSLAARGVSVRGDVTGFATGQLAGTGDKVWDAFGRYDGFVDVDFGKMGVIKGLGFHVHGEGRFGKGQSNFGFQLWPGNAAAALPLGGEGFSYDFSNALQDSTAPLVDFNDEQGLELWYSFAVTPWLKLTADTQVVNPARGDADTAVIAGLRANLAF